MHQSIVSPTVAALIAAVLACSSATALANGAPPPVPVQLDVTYSGCTVVEGPVSLGLTELPPAIEAEFIFLSPTYPPPLGQPFEPEVLSALLRVGDLEVTEVEFSTPFSLEFEVVDDVGGVFALSQLSYVMTEDVLWGLDALNSIAELRIRGEDESSGEAFEYLCPRTDATFFETTCDDTDGDDVADSCEDPIPVPVQLDVTYSECAVVEGPVSLGLTELPSAIEAEFVFLSPTYPPPLGQPFEPEVLSALLRVGDLEVTEVEFSTPFSLEFEVVDDVGGVFALSQLSYVMTEDVLWGLDALNSIAELRIRGEDESSGEAFEYLCPRTDATFFETTCDDTDGDGVADSCDVGCPPASVFFSRRNADADKGKELVAEIDTETGAIEDIVAEKTAGEGRMQRLTNGAGAFDIFAYKTFPGLSATLAPGAVLDPDDPKSLQLVPAGLRFNKNRFGMDKSGAFKKLGFPGDEGETGGAKELNANELLLLELRGDGATLSNVSLDILVSSRDGDGVVSGWVFAISRSGTGSLVVEGIVPFGPVGTAIVDIGDVPNAAGALGIALGEGDAARIGLIDLSGTFCESGCKRSKKRRRVTRPTDR